MDWEITFEFDEWREEKEAMLTWSECQSLDIWW